MVLGIFPAAVIQSLLWPLHNSFLALWMGMILVSTAWTAALELLQTVLLGSRRTGLSLQAVWKDQVQFMASSVHTLTETHQPLTARLMGVWLLPLTVIVHVSGLPGMPVANAILYSAALAVTWWYWFLVLPGVVFWWLGAAVMVGCCFALIELAGV